MSKLLDLLTATQILEETASPINGKLTVVKDAGWGVHIKAGGLTQSGGVAEKVWNTSLRQVKKLKPEINNCLILGLGGAGGVKVIEKYWPQARITGVDIDPVIVNLGKKYLGLKQKKIEIVIEDALSFVERQVKEKNKYDLVLVDIYVGDEVPKKFENISFFKLVQALLQKEGICVVNRLYYGQKRKIADKTYENLKKIFDKVRIVFPEANIMFVCF